MAGLLKQKFWILLEYSGVVVRVGRGDCNYLQLGFLWPRPSETDEQTRLLPHTAHSDRQWGRPTVIPRACEEWGECKKDKRNGIFARLIYNFARETDKTNLLQDASGAARAMQSAHTHTHSHIYLFLFGQNKKQMRRI